jgi:hypothetical protein
MKVISQSLAAVSMVLAALLSGASAGHASLDNELSVVDGVGRALTVQQWDTFLNGVAPLDRNRLTREWFHSGRVKYTVIGPAATDFTGTVELGYQVSFPWSMGVSLNFSYRTPNILLDKASLSPTNFNPLGSVITPNLFPGVSISADLGNGPGIQEVSTSRIKVVGPSGEVAVSNAHGTVTGAAGGVLLRPYARLISKAGEVVTTYGEPWNMG